MKTIDVVVRYIDLCGNSLKANRFKEVDEHILDKLIAAGIPMSRTWPPTPHRGTITTSHYPLTGDILYTWRGEEPHPFDHE